MTELSTEIRRFYLTVAKKNLKTVTNQRNENACLWNKKLMGKKE